MISPRTRVRISFALSYYLVPLSCLGAFLQDSFETLSAARADGVGGSLVLSDQIFLEMTRLIPANRAAHTGQLIDDKDMVAPRTTDLSGGFSEEQFIDSVSGTTLKAFDNQSGVLEISDPSKSFPIVLLGSNSLLLR